MSDQFLRDLNANDFSTVQNMVFQRWVRQAIVNAGIGIPVSDQYLRDILNSDLPTTQAIILQRWLTLLANNIASGGGGGGQTVNNQTGTSYQILSTDNVVTFQNAGAMSATLPQGGSVTLGKLLRLKNLGAGVLTVTAFAGDFIFANASITSFSLNQGGSVDLTWNGAQWILQ